MIGTSSDFRYWQFNTLSGANGRLGIGTTSPSSLLHIQGSTYNRVQTYFDGSYTSGFKFSDLNGGIWYDAGADDLYLNANHANSQVILQSGGSTTLTLDASNNATFAGTINSDNITVGKSDGNNSSISLTANTGNWTFTNVQASRNLEYLIQMVLAQL